MPFILLDIFTASKLKRITVYIPTLNVYISIFNYRLYAWLCQEFEHIMCNYIDSICVEECSSSVLLKFIKTYLIYQKKYI